MKQLNMGKKSVSDDRCCIFIRNQFGKGSRQSLSEKLTTEELYEVIKEDLQIDISSFTLFCRGKEINPSTKTLQ